MAAKAKKKKVRKIDEKLELSKIIENIFKILGIDTAF